MNAEIPTTIVNVDSLAATIDNLIHLSFFNLPSNELEYTKAMEWIASRQGLPGSYRNMFAPTELDCKQGARVFTGERISSRAGVSHILSEEASRILALQNVKSDTVSRALARSDDGMKAFFESPERKSGMYCCGFCSIAFIRHCMVRRSPAHEFEVAQGILRIKENRDDKGRWKRYPFYYTLLALLELDGKEVLNELMYAASGCERLLKKSPKEDDLYNFRRRELAKRALEKL